MRVTIIKKIMLYLLACAFLALLFYNQYLIMSNQGKVQKIEVLYKMVKKEKIKVERQDSVINILQDSLNNINYYEE